MFSYGPRYMDVPLLADQQRLTYINFVLTLNADWRIYYEGCTTEMDVGRRSGNSCCQRDMMMILVEVRTSAVKRAYVNRLHICKLKRRHLQTQYQAITMVINTKERYLETVEHLELFKVRKNKSDIISETGFLCKPIKSLRLVNENTVFSCIKIGPCIQLWMDVCVHTWLLFEFGNYLIDFDRIIIKKALWDFDNWELLRTSKINDLKVCIQILISFKRGTKCDMDYILWAVVTIHPLSSNTGVIPLTIVIYREEEQ